MSKSTYIAATVVASLFLVGLIFVAVPAYTAGVPASQHVAFDNANIVVDQSAQTSVSDQLVARAATSWPWYVTRASGLVAALAMVLLMLSGIGFITGTTYRFIEPLTGWATHRALGIILALSLVAHMTALYFDHFVPFGFGDILVPFASQYMPLELYGISFGSLYVALGILSFYLVILIVLVALLWVEGRTRAWKTIHTLSYIAMAFAFVHALFLGTDLSHGVLRFAWIALGVVIFLASCTRLWRAKTV